MAGLVPEGTERDKEDKVHTAIREGAKRFRYAFLYGARATTAGRIIYDTTRSVLQLDSGSERLQLVLTQVLHWFGILAAMWLMFLPQVRGIENDNATSLSLLILLALGTFLAGVHARVWRICIVGAFLAVAVPAIAWIQESVILLLVVVLLGAAVVLGFWWLRHREG